MVWQHSATGLYGDAFPTLANDILIAGSCLGMVEIEPFCAMALRYPERGTSRIVSRFRFQSISIFLNAFQVIMNFNEFQYLKAANSVVDLKLCGSRYIVLYCIMYIYPHYHMKPKF